jgi:hypothetical protein
MAENPFETLKTYRVYRIGSDLHIRQGDWVHCADDAQAIECARAKLGSEPVEIWQGTRQVDRLEPRLPAE